ncbi:MAG: type 4a pilus biogenesis protein PilO [Syntrophales bacterium]|nr:type 4a pilus biogenesis protein PilO [Syntrophales bacterium]
MGFADEFKKLNPRVKILFFVVFILLVAVVYWLFLLKPVVEKRAELKTKLGELDKVIKEKERIAQQRDKYLKEVEALKAAFREALVKLPDEKEIPGLLLSVSMAGRETGLEFVVFEPQRPAPPPPDKGTEVRSALKPSDQRAQEKQQDEKKSAPPKAQDQKQKPQERFYEEIPVKVSVNGTFPNTVSFFGRVASLPRIMNVEDVIVEGVKGGGQTKTVNTSCTIKTYMFMEKKGTEGKVR